LLRLFLNDTPELNRLIRQEESDNAHLDLALRLAVDDFNITTPIIGAVSISSFPSIYLLIHGAAIQTMKMNGILQSRNELNYSSGGVTVRTFDKTQLYQSWMGAFLSEYERKKQNFKIAQNISMAFGHGLFSEYSTISWFW
jgi:hypothetical protein